MRLDIFLRCSNLLLCTFAFMYILIQIFFGNFVVLIYRKKILNIYVTIWNEFVECVFRVYCNCVHLDYKKFDLHSLIELCFCVIIVILGVTSFACLFKYLDIRNEKKLYSLHPSGLIQLSFFLITLLLVYY